MDNMSDTEHTVMERDFKWSLFGHCAVAFFLLVSMGVNEGATFILRKTVPPSQPKSMGVEFVSRVNKAPKAEAKTEVKSISTPTPKASRLQEEGSRQVTPQVSPIKRVQRQASEQSKVTRTSMAKSVRLNQRVGVKAMAKAQAMGSVAGKGGSKIAGDHLPTNAQVLGSKQVSSSALKQVKESIVKKSSSVLSQVPTVESVKKKGEKSLTEGKVSDKQKKHKQQLVQKEKQALERRKAESKKKQLAAEAEKKRLEEAQKKQLAAEAEKKRVEAEVQKKQMAAEAERKRLEHQAYEQRTISKYGQMITAHIQNHAVFNLGMDKLKVNLKVELTLSGDVRSVLLAQTSGNASFDRLAINAVYKASPLPLPEDKEISRKMSTINLVIKPDNLS